MIAILRGRQIDFVRAPRDPVVPIRLSTATVVVLPHSACAQDAAEKADALSFENVVGIVVLLGSVAFTQLGQRISDGRIELKGALKDVKGELKDVKGELKGCSDELKGVKDSLKGLVVAITISNRDELCRGDGPVYEKQAGKVKNFTKSSERDEQNLPDLSERRAVGKVLLKGGSDAAEMLMSDSRK